VCPCALSRPLLCGPAARDATSASPQARPSRGHARPGTQAPQAIDRGDLRDQADAVHRVGFNGASITQLFDQTLLVPDIEAQILPPASSDGGEPITRRVVRSVVRAPGWEGRSGRATARVNGSARIPTALPPYQPD